jgi:hypothetical protein
MAGSSGLLLRSYVEFDGFISKTEYSAPQSRS